MTETVTHCRKLFDALFQFIGLVQKLLLVDPETAIGCEHARDFLKGETGTPAQGDERQPFQDIGVKKVCEAHSFQLTGSAPSLHKTAKLTRAAWSAPKLRQYPLPRRLSFFLTSS